MIFPSELFAHPGAKSLKSESPTLYLIKSVTQLN